MGDPIYAITMNTLRIYINATYRVRCQQSVK